MSPGARLQAAMEILQDIETLRRPASVTLSDWGQKHRFAGSSDRSAIGTLVFDALRRKRSLAHHMDDDRPRALALGVLAFTWRFSAERIEALMVGDRYAPEAPCEREKRAMNDSSLDGAPDAVRADVPDWLWPGFVDLFGARAVDEGAALAQRAPLDLRVNTLKADRNKVLKALAHFGAKPTPASALGVRIEPPNGADRHANVQAESSFQKGWFEVQDEGSQIVALLSGAAPALQIADICAGAGGKTLALAALMQNKGQIHAYDRDRNRLKAIFARLKRAGVRNTQVLTAGHEQQLDMLGNKMDLILIDAPCTGSGVWRRKPDAKWRLNAQKLLERQAAQAALLDQAARLTRSGASIVYVTCSILNAENDAQITAFLERNTDFVPAPLQASEFLACDPAGACSRLFTPATDGTDGFFVARLLRR